MMVVKENSMQATTILPLKTQQGSVTLLTAVLLLIAITLVTFVTAKTVMMETKMAANNFRAAQSITAADAAMDYAVKYLDDGMDQDGNGSVDNMTVLAFETLTGIKAEYSYDNNDGNCTSAGTMGSALISATGYSDDGIASRTVTQCAGTRNILDGGGPKQTLVSGASVGLTGSAQIINRYNDLNVWSASTTAIGNSSAMDTYIRPVDLEVSDLTTAELTDDTTSPSIPNVQKVSSNGLGGGTDIYFNDPRLAVSSSDLFDLFFIDPIGDLASMADNVGQKLAAGAQSADLNGLSGIIYVDGDAAFTGNNTIGTTNSPALLIVNGDFDLNGGTIHGLVYVTGDTDIAGSPSVIGTMISEGNVSGTGTLTLVYAQHIGDSSTTLKGATGIISGSWKDWQ